MNYADNSYPLDHNWPLRRYPYQSSEKFHNNLSSEMGMALLSCAFPSSHCCPSSSKTHPSPPQEFLVRENWTSFYEGIIQPHHKT